MRRLYLYIYYYSHILSLFLRKNVIIPAPFVVYILIYDKNLRNNVWKSLSIENSNKNLKGKNLLYFVK